MKKMICILLTVCLFCSGFAMSASAFARVEYQAKIDELTEKWKTIGEQNGWEEWETDDAIYMELNDWINEQNTNKPKITPLLQDVMDEHAPDDVLSVYMHFECIPYKTVNEVATAVCELAETAYAKGTDVSFDTVREITKNAGLERFADGVVAVVDNYLKEEGLHQNEVMLQIKVEGYLYNDTRETLANDLLKEFGVTEEQVTDRFFSHGFVVVNLKVSDIEAVAQNENVRELDWSSGDLFDYVTYLNNEYMMSVSCMCIGLGERAYPEPNCYHHVGFTDGKSYEIFRWLGDVDCMMDFENDMTKVPHCFSSKVSNAFGSGRVLFLNGVPNLGDYLMFFERRIKEVYIPNSVKHIGEHTFSQFADVSIYCYAGSYAEEYAKTHNIECHLLDTDEVIPAAMSGDVNGDSTRNLKDVLALRKALATDSVNTLSAGADCNVDGEVNLKDVLLLRQHLADMFV